MKKILLTLCMLIVSSVCMFAGSDIKVTAGDKKFMKTAEGTATVTVNAKDAQYDKKMPLGQKITDVANFERCGVIGFTEKFNKRSKKVQIIDDATKAKYNIIINISNVDQYIKVFGFIPSPATKIWGTIQIKDAKSGEILVEGNFAKIDGGANPSPDGTIADSFEELAKQAVRLK